MKNSNLHRNILVSSILCFGSLTGLAGAAVYFDPTLMNNWIGPALLGAPPAIGLIFYLIARSWTYTKIIEELGITHGAARIDIAVVNGTIHGYELKSDKDTLNRLPGQIEIYNSVLDKVTLIVGKSHVHKAIKIVPEWWGITIAKITPPKKTVSFCYVRKPKLNPNPDYEAIAALLWREEALNILEEINEAKGVRSKTRNIIYQRLAETLSKNDLKEKVRNCLKIRINWRSDLQYIPNGD